MPAVTPPAAPLTVFISEVHYDNTGTDVNEAIAIQGVAGTNLTGWSIVLYNGNPSTAATPYGTLSLNGLVVDDEGAGIGEISVLAPVGGLQNGTADGMALWIPCWRQSPSSGGSGRR